MPCDSFPPARVSDADIAAEARRPRLRHQHVGQGADFNRIHTRSSPVLHAFLPATFCQRRLSFRRCRLAICTSSQDRFCFPRPSISCSHSRPRRLISRHRTAAAGTISRGCWSRVCRIRRHSRRIGTSCVCLGAARARGGGGSTTAGALQERCAGRCGRRRPTAGPPRAAHRRVRRLCGSHSTCC